jgi:hypothetical protein
MIVEDRQSNKFHVTYACIAQTLTELSAYKAVNAHDAEAID